MPETTGRVAAVEVNECRVFATRLGSEWWAEFRRRFHRTGRITTLIASPAGELVSVACDDQPHARWLADQMTTKGIPETAVKVKVTW